MKIGIIGVGHIGKTLALRLAEAGHDVVVANSRGPETRRDIAVAAIMERMSSPTTNPDAEFGLRLSRALYM